MQTVLLVINLLAAISLVVVILLQRSEGGALGGLGGSNGGGLGLFTARGTGNLLTRATAILATIFIVTCLALSLTGKRVTPVKKSLLDTPVATEQTVPESKTPEAPSAPKAAE